MHAVFAHLLAWFHRVTRGRCGSTFETAFHEELRCELAHGHRGAHRATVRTSFDREYRYDWTYPWDSLLESGLRKSYTDAYLDGGADVDGTHRPSHRS